jgi:hypothetical protein
MPNRYPTKKQPLFSSLSRHKRRDAVIALERTMRREAGEYGGLFTSELVLNEAGRPDVYCQGFDFYFPGVKPWTLWNATIITAQKSFWAEAQARAHTLLRASLTDVELEREASFKLTPAAVSSTGKVLTYTMEKEAIGYAVFDGRTYGEQWEHLTREIVRLDPPRVFETFEIDSDYVYGTGLYIVLDAPVINRESIELAIRKFKDLDEQPWRSPRPVPLGHLQQVSEGEALAAYRRLAVARWPRA